MPTRRLPNPPGLTVRPLRAGDKAELLDLFERLSPRSRLRRFLAPKPALSRRELAYFTEIDHRRHEALVAVGPDGDFVGVARYACGFGETTVAEVAFAVADAWQGRGVATALAAMLVERARANGIERLEAQTLPENRAARKLLARAGFEVRCIADGLLELSLDLTAAGDAADRRAA
jgi:RimJ/RimL family protein N-acetyltransferase